MLDAFDVSPPVSGEPPAKYVPKLEEADPAMDVEEWERMAFQSNVGAIAYYLKAVPCPGFTVKTHLRHLLALQQRLVGRGAEPHGQVPSGGAQAEQLRQSRRSNPVLVQCVDLDGRKEVLRKDLLVMSKSLPDGLEGIH